MIAYKLSGDGYNSIPYNSYNSIPYYLLTQQNSSAGDVDSDVDSDLLDCIKRTVS